MMSDAITHTLLLGIVLAFEGKRQRDLADEGQREDAGRDEPGLAGEDRGKRAADGIKAMVWSPALSASSAGVPSAITRPVSMR